MKQDAVDELARILHEAITSQWAQFEAAVRVGYINDECKRIARRLIEEGVAALVPAWVRGWRCPHCGGPAVKVLVYGPPLALATGQTITEFTCAQGHVREVEGEYQRR